MGACTPCALQIRHWFTVHGCARRVPRLTMCPFSGRQLGHCTEVHNLNPTFGHLHQQYHLGSNASASGIYKEALLMILRQNLFSDTMDVLSETHFFKFIIFFRGQLCPLSVYKYNLKENLCLHRLVRICTDHYKLCFAFKNQLCSTAHSLKPDTLLYPGPNQAQQGCLQGAVTQ